MKNKVIIDSCFLIFLAVCIISCAEKKHADNNILISSAISMKLPLNKIAYIYKKDRNSNLEVFFNFASSGELESQIIQGASVDIFVSAGNKQIERLKEKNMLLTNTIKIISSGELVVVSSKKFFSKNIYTNFNFLLENNYKYIAIGETNTVPVGEYAVDALIQSGVMKSINNKLVYGRSATEVLTWAETGNAEYAVVYKSDAINHDAVKVIYNIEPSLHKKIIYQAAVINGSKKVNEAESFILFLESEEAKNIFVEYGFNN